MAHSKMEKEPNFEALKEQFQHHIDSFDHLLESGLETMMSSIKPVSVHNPTTGDTLQNILS